MVPLSIRSEYLQQFGASRHSDGFVRFLLGEPLEIGLDHPLRSADEATLVALFSIQNGDHILFAKAYDFIGRRDPKPDSDWLFNDFLLFSITAGAVKFQTQDDKLRQILQLRNKHSEAETQLISLTLLDALEGRFDSSSNYYPLLLVLKHILGLPISSSDRLNEVYDQLVSKPFPPFTSSLLNAIALRAVDVVVLSKEVGDFDTRRKLNDFVRTFGKRVEQLASVAWTATATLVVAVTGVFFYYYLTSPPSEAGYIDKVLQLLPLLGFSSLIGPVFYWRKEITSFFRKKLSRFFGSQTEEDTQ